MRDKLNWVSRRFDNCSYRNILPLIQFLRDLKKHKTHEAIDSDFLGCLVTNHLYDAWGRCVSLLMIVFQEVTRALHRTIPKIYTSYSQKSSRHTTLWCVGDIEYHHNTKACAVSIQPCSNSIVKNSGTTHCFSALYHPV